MARRNKRTKAAIAFRAMIRAARKQEFLTNSARETALIRFNRKRERQGLPPMDFIPAGEPGSFTERRHEEAPAHVFSTQTGAP